MVFQILSMPSVILLTGICSSRGVPTTLPTAQAGTAQCSLPLLIQERCEVCLWPRFSSEQERDTVLMYSTRWAQNYQPPVPKQISEMLFKKCSCCHMWETQHVKPNQTPPKKKLSEKASQIQSLRLGWAAPACKMMSNSSTGRTGLQEMSAFLWWATVWKEAPAPSSSPLWKHKSAFPGHLLGKTSTPGLPLREQSSVPPLPHQLCINSTFFFKEKNVPK